MIGIALLALSAILGIVIPRLASAPKLGSAFNPCSVNQGCTGINAFGQGWLYSTGGNSALAASTSPTVNYIIATSTRASIFPYASSTVLTAGQIYDSGLSSSRIPYTSTNGLFVTTSNLQYNDVANRVTAVYASTTAVTATTLCVETCRTTWPRDTRGFTVDGGGSAISTGKVKGYFVFPDAATITGWNITVDTGTVTVKVWKIAAGTAKPTSSDSINTSGVSISSGTSIRSSTLSDFTTTSIAAGDIVAYNIEAVSGVTEMTFELELKK